MQNNNKRLTSIVSVLILLLLYFSISKNTFALRKLALKAEVFALPSFRRAVENYDFCGIGIDGNSGNIALASDTRWCEIPYKEGKPDMKGAFIAPTKGFRLKAVSSYPHDIYVFDQISGRVMGGKTKFKLPFSVINVSGMTYHNHRLFLGDSGKGLIYELQLSGVTAKVLNRYAAHKDLCGLASDGKTLYSCSSSFIVEYDENIKPVYQYKVDVALNGITCTDRREIFAVAKDKNEIYRFRIRR